METAVENFQEDGAEVNDTISQQIESSPEVAPAEELKNSEAENPVKINPLLQLKDIYITPSVLIPEDVEVTKAKSFLKTTSANGKDNLYEHLASLIMNVLDTRPANALENFEKISEEVKLKAFQSSAKTIFNEVKAAPKTLAASKQIINLCEVVANLDENGVEVPDLLELNRLWEAAGLSIGQQETFALFLSLRELAKDKNLKSVRLWGKIFGTQGNYIIAEADGGEEPAEEEEAPAAEQKEEEPGVPKPKTKPQQKLTPEKGNGVNKYSYYVCNQVGGAWTRLPDAKPDKLRISRSVHKYFTGNLSHQIASYPEFKDTEAQYLRCQIARISASTVVSPVNYYITDPEAAENDEETEGSKPPKPIIINPEYESASNEAFLNLDNWVHHVPFILPQGRVVWQNPYPKQENAGDEEENEDENKPEEVVAEPEAGPELLVPLVNDEEFDKGPAWTTQVSHKFSSTKFSPVVLRSVRWPGAHAIVYNDKFTNIYIGYGLKDLGSEQSITLPTLPEVQLEYASGVEGALGIPEDITEMNDPTVEEEQNFEDEMMEKKELAQEEAENEEQ